MLSEGELECPLPSSPDTSSRAVNTWNISVSNDGETFSNELQLTVYDSKCMDCQCGGQCQPKVSPDLKHGSAVTARCLCERSLGDHGVRPL